MNSDFHYYVYAYFDPRNYDLFYVGKGKGSRKNAHQPDKAGTQKERQIAEIHRAGLKPLIKVIATNLSEEQAFLVEKALIWRSGKSLTNLSSGMFADNFRPPNTLHLSLPGFDTTRGIFFVNVGLWEHRQWEDCCKFGFLAAGYGRKYSSQLDRLEVGSIAAAYMSKHGYVGIGRVLSPPVPVKDFRHKGQPLKKSLLQGPDLFHDATDEENCEYLVAVKWIKKVPRDEAKFQRKAGLFATQQIVASISGQPITLKFLERQFNVNFGNLLATE